MQQANVSTDEFDRAPDGYPFNPPSDYYRSYSGDQAYAQDYVGEFAEHQEEQEALAEEEPTYFNLMVRVIGPGESAMAV